MNCKEFERYLLEGVSTRLPEDQAAAMEAHRAVCPVCAQAEAEERGLRARWRDLPAVSSAPDFWPRLAARLDSPAPRPASRFVFGRRLAFGAGLAAVGALCAVLWTHGSGRAPVEPVDEQRVVTLVATMQRLPDPDSDPTTTDTRLYRDDAGLFLKGGGR